MQSIFFYGLFMDVALLRDLGLEPLVDGVAELADHALRIGAKATLLATPGARAWGVVMRLSEADVERLYSRPGVERYRPEPVTVLMMDARWTRNCTWPGPRSEPQRPA